MGWEALSVLESLCLPEAQAVPIRAALQAAYESERRLERLCYMYEQAQLLRLLMRDVVHARPGMREHAVQRADHQWRVVCDLLEQLALAEPCHAGSAEGGC